MGKYIIALDEGTTSLRTVLYDINEKKIVKVSQKPFKQFYPKSGWVEQDANEIWTKQKETLDDILHNINQNDVIGLGLTNQRETVVAWNKTTGEPIYNAIVWQCKRTSKEINNLPTNIKRKIKNKTGLIADAYFSASKMKWILTNVPEAKKLAAADNLCLGTIDSFLAYKLTGQFVTDTTNASRTMLFNINTLSWDDELLKIFGVPKNTLPKVVSCNENIGKCLDYTFDLCGMIGDQQSSMFGQACFKKGMTKATYGTGCFILMNVGNTPSKAKNVLSTIGYTIDGKTTYALEGSVFSACNAIDWLKNNLCFYEDVAQTAEICTSIPSTDGVYFVPAFSGLGAPYWDGFSKGTITGMTLATNKAHLIRACFESIAYNTYAIIKDMSLNSCPIKELHVDGGGSKNSFLLQFQSDIIQRNVLKSKESESTVLGAVYMVAVCKKIFNIQDIAKMYTSSVTVIPKITIKERNTLYKGWENAIKIVKYDSKKRREK